MQQPITHRQNIIIRTQACELTDDIITLAISYVSEVGVAKRRAHTNAASGSVKYIDLNRRQNTRLLYGWAMYDI